MEAQKQGKVGRWLGKLFVQAGLTALETDLKKFLPEGAALECALLVQSEVAKMAELLTDADANNGAQIRDYYAKNWQQVVDKLQAAAAAIQKEFSKT